jgi:hypothetical protein
MREFALTYGDIIKRLDGIEKTIRIDQQQMNYNTERIDDAFALLTEILNDTKRTNQNLNRLPSNLKYKWKQKITKNFKSH